MGSLLHGNATTTPRIRKEIQESKESAAELVKRLNLNIKTVLKWKKQHLLMINARVLYSQRAFCRQQSNRLSVNLDVSPNCLS